jgi:hypothetical protein
MDSEVETELFEITEWPNWVGKLADCSNIPGTPTCLLLTLDEDEFKVP